jgi:hypothetical protein
VSFRAYGFLYVALCFFQPYDGHRPFCLCSLKSPLQKKITETNQYLLLCLQVIYNDQGAASKGSIWFFSVPQVSTRPE